MENTDKKFVILSAIGIVGFIILCCILGKECYRTQREKNHQQELEDSKCKHFAVLLDQSAGSPSYVECKGRIETQGNLVVCRCD